MKIIYTPKEDITLYELALVLKMFTFFTLPEHMRDINFLFDIYNALPDNAKRHFTIIDE